VLFVVAVSFAVLGQFNSERYFLVCSDGKAEAHRGRAFPWPFGHSRMEGLKYRPVEAGKESICHSHELETEEALRKALLGLVVNEAERLAQRARPEDLEKVRRLVDQGRLLVGGDPSVKETLNDLEADLYFNEGRTLLRETEESLRRSRGMFEKARAMEGSSAAEAKQWIRLIDELLGLLRRGIARDLAARPSVAADAGAPTVRPVDATVPVPSRIPTATDAGLSVPTPLVTPGPDAGLGGGILL
jgi:hypothetical protein